MTNTIQMPDQGTLINTFTYKNGSLYWKSTRAYNVQEGSKAGAVNNKGYVVVGIGKKRYLEHRLIYKMLNGIEPDGIVDHINRNKTDNRIENLRVVSRSINALNNSAKGISYRKSTGKYVARLGVDNKRIHIGYFDTEEEASSHYKEFKELYMEMKAC